MISKKIDTTPEVEITTFFLRLAKFIQNLQEEIIVVSKIMALFKMNEQF